MPILVRPIDPDELADWVRVGMTAFHAEHAAEDEVALRREVLHQPTPRTLGAFDGRTLVGTLHTFPTQLSVSGGQLEVDAVTSASVLPTHRRRGILRQMLGHDLRAARERGEAASILVAAEYPIYGRFGYGPAIEHATYTLDTQACFLGAAPGQVEFVNRAAMRELAPCLFERFRRARPGQIARDSDWWDARLGERQPPWTRGRPAHCAVYRDTSGEAQGYLLYHVAGNWERRVPRGTLEVGELIALTPEAYLGLWRFCSEIDLVATVHAGLRCTDEPLPWLLDNPRAAWLQTERADFIWLRPLDVPTALAGRRYACPGELVLEVHDPLGAADGRFILRGGPDGAECRATDGPPDLALSLAALGSLLLGGTRWRLLAEAGLVEEQRPGALDRAQVMFASGVTPWCSTFF